jgi:hypothetical protein
VDFGAIDAEKSSDPAMLAYVKFSSCGDNRERKKIVNLILREEIGMALVVPRESPI